MVKEEKQMESSPNLESTERYSPEDAEYFREIILKRRENMMDEMGILTEATRSNVKETGSENSTYSLHMADQGTDSQEREKAFLFASRDGKYLKYLERSLEMIENGSYGICTDCELPIQKKRLELVPTSRLCISCKLQEEKGRLNK